MTDPTPAAPEGDARADLDALVDMAFTVAERALRREEDIAPALLRVDANRGAELVEALDHADEEAITDLLRRAETELEQGARAAAVVYAVGGLQGVDGFDEAVVARLRAPDHALQVALPHRGNGDQLELGEIVASAET